MKKIYIFLALFLFFASFPNIAYAESAYFGKVKTQSAYFYQNADTSSQLFILPYSYFVQILGVENDVFYQAVYKDIEGYVLKSDVTLMSGTPSTPYFNTTFVNYTSYELYEQPTVSSNVVVTFEENQTLNYYGAIDGEMMKENVSTWYFCSTVINGVTYQGYIYSGVVNKEPTIIINTESFTEISEEVFTATTNGEEFAALSTGTKILLIIAIAVPSAFILFFLIKPSKTKKQKVEKKGIRKIQYGDYFEFDEKDL